MKINGTKIVQIGDTFGLPTFEDEKGFYVKVTNKLYKDLSNNDVGLYNTLCKLETIESKKSYDILLWQKK